jgi:nucleotide-binding universal stress UspA family protein
MPELRTITVAVDGSAPSQEALAWAQDLAKLAGASLTIVGVMPPPQRTVTPAGEVIETPAQERRYLPELLSRYSDAARRAGVRNVSTAVLNGPVVDQLLAFHKEKRPDLMILGARGLSTARRVLLGSVSDSVVHHAKGTILIVRATERSARS